MADVTILDHPERYPALDPGNMLGHIQSLWPQVRTAYQTSRAVALPDDYRQVRQVVLTGMGGSGIGGALLAGLAEPLSRVPLLVWRGYSLPHFVDEETLVVASSYSGETEQTLSALADAHERGAKLLAVTTGGELASRAEALGIPLYQFTYTSQPRAAVGYSFGALLGLAVSLDLLPDQAADLKEAEAVMAEWAAEIGPTVPTVRNPAKKLASELKGDFPFVFAAEHLTAVAQRWKGQFNENSKSWAAYDTLPEAGHNTVAGFAHPYIAPEDVFVVVLDSERYHPRVRAQIQPMLDLLAQANIAELTITARGESALAQTLGLVLLGDYVSYYLALLNDEDPTPVRAIETLKRRMGRAS